MTRVFGPKHYQNYGEHTVFEPLDSLTGWVESTVAPGGSSAITAGIGPAGEDVMSFTVDGLNGQVRRTKTISKEMGGGFGIWIKFNDPNVTRVTIFLSEDAGFTKYFSHAINRDTYLLTDGWQFYERPLSQFANTGGASWDNVMTELRVIAIGVGGAGTVDVCNAFVDMRTRPQCMIMFDDSNDTDATIAEPYLTARGLAATSYTIKSKIDTANFLSTVQLQQLYDAGWDLGVHHIDDFTTLTYAQQLANLIETRDYLSESGWVRGASHFSYPLGRYNTDTKAAMDVAGILTARNIVTFGFSPNENYSLGELTSRGGHSGTGAQALTELDKCVKEGATCTVFTHRLNPTTGGDHWAEAEWKIFIDGLAVRRDLGLVDCPTISQWHLGLGV